MPLRDYPLAVVVGVAEDEVLSDFYQRRIRYYGIAIILTIFIVGVCSALIYILRERKKTEDAMRYLGTHDILTGLYNRAFLENELGRLENSKKTAVEF